MLDRIIIYLTEKKLQLKNLKEGISDKWYDATYSADLVKGEIKKNYNKNLKSKVDKVKKYFTNLYDDLDSASTPFYNLIWHLTDNRVFGYILSALISVLALSITGLFTLVGVSNNILLLSLIPVSLIPMDIITTTILFIHNRVKRAYNKSLTRMKKEYNVRDDKDLVELYKKQNAKEETKTVKKESTPKENITSKKEYMSDSEFIEKLFGFVNNSKYIDPQYREAYLIEVENVINRYSESRKQKTDEDLKTSIEFLQGEYNRYLRNIQQEQTTNTRSYPARIMKK